MGLARKLNALAAAGVTASGANDDRLEREDGWIPFAGPRMFTATGNPFVIVRSSASLYALQRAAVAFESYSLGIPLEGLYRISDVKGLRMIDIQVAYQVAVVAATTITVVLNRVQFADGSGPTTSAPGGTLTFDTNHDTNAKRIAVGVHLMRATLQFSGYQSIDAGLLVAELQVAFPNTCVFTAFGGGYHVAHDI